MTCITECVSAGQGLTPGKILSYDAFVNRDLTPAQAAALVRANASQQPPLEDSLLALLMAQGPAARAEIVAVWELQDELEAASEAGLWPF